MVAFYLHQLERTVLIYLNLYEILSVSFAP